MQDEGGNSVVCLCIVGRTCFVVVLHIFIQD